MAEKAKDLARQKNLSQSVQWQKLLHFEKDFFFQLNSQIDTQAFFISPKGAWDLQAELDETIDYLADDSADAPEDRRLQCRYPARTIFLRKNLPEITFPTVPCERFEMFNNNLKGVSISLVFSSYYLNNPSSAFGHTFLRINKAPASDGKRYELLDYGINYAATVTSTNPISYTFMGFFGMFPGNFTTIPYYFKVREYNDSESRDLWEYELNVTPEEVEMMIAHLWEMGPTDINYWYLTENCSYHMLTLLEAAAPRLQLTSRLKKWVIPSDTVQVVWDYPGLVKNVTFRPSLRAHFNEGIKKLDAEDTKILKSIIYDKNFPDELSGKSEEKRKNILDSAIDFMDYKHVNEIVKGGEMAEWKRKILQKRSEIKLSSQPLVIEPREVDRPHLSHGSRRIGVGYLSSANGYDLYDFELKFALHDQLEKITGYPEYAEISFGDFNFTFSPEENKIHFENFTFFKIISHTPLSEYSHDISWQMKIGFERILDENCFGCHAAAVSGGAGYTFEFTENPKLTLFTGLKANLYYAFTGDPSEKLMPGLGPAARIRLRMTENFIALFDGWYRHDFNAVEKTYQEYSLATQWSPSKSWGLRLTAKDKIFDQSLKMDLLYYY